ncbi:MAG: hypothetical protein K4571_06370 [Deltaproteobacteria bacterium]
MEKIKRRATLRRSDGVKLDVNFFLSPYAEGHSGKELILDILNSASTFLPVEDVDTGAIIFFNKSNVMSLEIAERNLLDETLLSREKRVHVELTNGETLKMSIFLEMPEERSRVSDYLNSPERFIYLCGKERDILLNKAFVFSVKDS